ncbi:MAG TPA: hypothetical protein VGW10_04560, partial [Solirubrobacteraceae bacterium]|nr:hypothetical protein [Solirubrobacteraceae bacterium]
GDDRLLGGPATDRLDGGPGGDALDGGDGDDVLAGSAGADRLAGGDGDDSLVLDETGDGAPDAAAGGPGRDAAVWGGEPRPPLAVRLVIDLGDGRGPDGVAGERDALADDVEDVRGVVRAFAVTGSDGPNELFLAGSGSIDGGGGDDALGANVGEEGDVRLVGGSGEDRIHGGTGTRVDTRDGAVDRILCRGGFRSLRMDVGRDRIGMCVPQAFLDRRSTISPVRRRAGSLVRGRVTCADLYLPCDVRIRVRLTRPGTVFLPGRALAPFSVRVPARGTVTVAVRVPRDAAPGRRIMKFTLRRASPFPGVRARFTRGDIAVRVVRGAR